MKLFIQEFEDKFINNLSLIDHENIIIVTDSIHDDLYSIHYKYDFDAYVFISSLMTNEIYQYILEFNKIKKIILYHDTFNENIITALAPFCTNIGALETKDIIKIPTLINDHLFFNSNKQRNDYIPCFIDNVEVLDEDILSVLYPNSKFRIRLFGSSSIKHPQNIGLLSEQEKAEILNESESCLLIDDSYLLETISCGTKVLRPKKGKLIEDKISPVTDVETYVQFLIRILQQ
jgi:hypothetical protein